MNEEDHVWSINKLSNHSLRKYEAIETYLNNLKVFFGVSTDYTKTNAYEILRQKVDDHFKKELKVDSKQTVEKLLKMRKDDRLDDGIIKRKSTRNKEKVQAEGKVA